MSPTTITYSAELVVTTCWCGMRHAVPKELRNLQERQVDNGVPEPQVQAIYCPIGHIHMPAREGKAARLERELEQERQCAQAERELREDTERRLIAQKGQTTKARQRAAAALCPCCGRSFVQLRRHMATKHPDYDPEKTT